MRIVPILEAKLVVAAEVVGVVVEDVTDPRDGERATGIVVAINNSEQVRMEASHPLSGEE